MVKINELRIGNKVLVNGKEIEIFSMAPSTDGNTYGFNLFEGGMPEFYDYDCEPIPLTPEILEKCGFEKSFGKELPYNLVAFKKADIILNGDYTITIEGMEGELWFIGKPMEFLHQLQNLYFALTGEELEIKINP